MTVLFDWDEWNLKKVRSHGITPQEAEEVILNDPVFMYSQQAQEEEREYYFGETFLERLLAVSITYRNEKVRVVTAYDMTAKQKQRYLRKRVEQRWHQHGLL